MLFNNSYCCHRFRRASRAPRNFFVCKRRVAIPILATAIRAIFSLATIVDYNSATIKAPVSLAKQIPTKQRPLIFSSFPSCSSRINFHFSDSSNNNCLPEPRSIIILCNYPLDLRQTTNRAALGAPAAL